MYRRAGDITEQHWSSDYVEGKRFAQEKEVYILIDGDSFSAAEDFSYTMKNLKRATLIGETTGGAAHSGDSVRLSNHFNLFLPTGRPISPITNTNWEGTGVNPDVPVAAENALNKAQKIILEKLISNEKDPRRIARINARIAEL
jgi:C-terminal processing protease CtpA/Prc